MSNAERDEGQNAEERAAESFFNRFARVVGDAADAMAESDALIGQTISHYRMEARLGEGGMGVVYRAHDTRLNRPVALKFLPDHLNADRRAKERFLIEARAAAALDHPNICNIYEVGETESQRTFIAMAFYDGETLDESLKRGPLPWQKALDYATQIARGLAAAHERGIVHRDVKPSNVIVTPNGVVKLLDFGIARMTDVPGVTAAGITLGTMTYMSPEQATGRPVDARTDLWSLGVMLHEMCTGVRPFRGNNTRALLQSILNDRPTPPSKAHPELPRALDSVTLRLLEKDPAQRYGDAAELLAELARVQTITPAPPSRKRTMLAAFVLVTLLATGSLIWTLLTRRESPVNPALAVLPLENLSKGPGDEAFAEAMHEQLVMEIGTIRSMLVISRSGVRQYRDSPLSLPEIAAQLNVTHVLEGSAALDGDSVRINVRLHDHNGNRLWQNTYWEAVTNTLRLQAEISQHVARVIRATITPEEQTRFADNPTIPASAHWLIAEGLEFFEQGGPFSEVGPDSARRLLDLAAARFVAATVIDSTWARPWAYLAQTRHWQASSGEGLPNWKARSDSLYALSEEAALRAIDYDSTEANAWAALGYVRRRWKWDWDGARLAYETAHRINPNATEAEWGLAILYETTGDLERAVDAFARVRERDPESHILRVQAGNALNCANRFDEGLKWLYPVSGTTLGLWERFSRANGLIRARRYDQAIEEFQRLLRSDETPSAYLAYAYLKAGDTMRAHKLVNEQKGTLPPTGETWRPSHELLIQNLVVGDTAAVLANLDAMIRSKTLSPTIRCDPYFDDLIAIDSARALMEAGMNLRFAK